jgi:ATP-dependent helicase/nuclease subunit A
MARNWTPEQKRAIDTRDRTMLLSAAAGSGKTAVLTQRIIELLLDPEHPLELSRIMAVTFTRAAAAELKARIASALADAIEKNPGNAHLTRQLRLLPTAHISTIDSLNIYLLRRFSHCVGVSESFRVADSQESELLRASVMEELLQDGYAGQIPEVSREAFCTLVSHLVGVRQEEQLGGILLKLCDRLETLPAGIDAVRTYAEQYEEAAQHPVTQSFWFGQLSSRISEYATHCRTQLTQCLAEIDLDPASDKLLRGKLATYDEILARLTHTDWQTVASLKAAVLDAPYPKTISASPKHTPTEVEERAQALCRDCKKALTTASGFAPALLRYTDEEWRDLYAALGVQCRVLWHILAEFTRRHDAESHRRNAYCFSQIGRMTYQLLMRDGARTEIAETLRGEFDAVCVDEYQDVNPLQHAVFEAISPERGRFLVGDIKQSIYRFRHAEPDIFAHLRAEFPPLGQGADVPAVSHFMSANFRSDRSIIDCINCVFDALFGTAGQSIGYCAEDALQYKKDDPRATCSFLPVVAVFDSAAALNRRAQSALAAGGDPLPRAKDLTPEGGADAEAAAKESAVRETEEEEKATLREARWIAAQIQALLTHGTLHDGVTPLRPGDIAILLRAAKSKYKPYAEALAAYGIRCAEPENAGFFSNPEVLLTLDLLRCIDNPRRDIPLAGVLCSPLYHFTPDDLTVVRRAAPEGIPLYDALCLYCGAHPDFARGQFFLSQLASLRAAAEGMPVDKLLRRVFTETPLMAIAGAEGEGGELNLRLLYNYARSYEGAAFEGLYSFIAFVTKQIESSATFSPKTPGAPSDAVSICTVHASKGLEYPVVFLADCGSTFSNKETSNVLLCDAEAGIAFHLKDPTGRVLVSNPVKALLAGLIRRKNTEEEMRLLYVALTRARERLYITAAVPGSSSLEKLLADARTAQASPDAYTTLQMNSYLKMLLFALAGHPDKAELLLDPPIPEATEGEAHAAEATVSEEEVSTLAGELRKRFSFVYPYAHLRRLPKKLSVSDLKPTILDTAEAETAALPLSPDPAPAPAQETSPEERPEKWRRMPEAYAGVRPPDPTDRGIATHLFLQFCDFDALSDGGVEPELRRLLAGNYIDEATAALMRRDELEKFRTSPLLAEMRQAKQVKREFRFHIKLPASRFTSDPSLAQKLQGEVLFVQGVIDALIEHPDGTLTLVDYKTDRLTREELADPTLAGEKLRRRHAAQLRYYAEAVKSIFGQAPAGILLYALQSGMTYPVAPDEGEPCGLL